jgi:acetylornithine/succinyldiaminopimelate/putrescine aminotransferase
VDECAHHARGLGLLVGVVLDVALDVPLFTQALEERGVMVKELQELAQVDGTGHRRISSRTGSL